MWKYFRRTLTRLLFACRLGDLLAAFRPELYVRFTAQRLRLQGSHGVEWGVAWGRGTTLVSRDESLVGHRQDASSWPGEWAEITVPVHEPVNENRFFVFVYSSSTWSHVLEPVAATCSEEAAHAAARLLGLEVRTYHCLSGCPECGGRGYLVGEMAPTRWYFNEFLAHNPSFREEFEK